MATEPFLLVVPAGFLKNEEVMLPPTQLLVAPSKVFWRDVEKNSHDYKVFCDNCSEKLSILEKHSSQNTVDHPGISTAVDSLTEVNNNSPNQANIQGIANTTPGNSNDVSDQNNKHGSLKRPSENFMDNINSPANKYFKHTEMACASTLKIVPDVQREIIIPTDGYTKNFKRKKNPLRITISMDGKRYVAEKMCDTTVISDADIDAKPKRFDKFANDNVKSKVSRSTVVLNASTVDVIKPQTDINKPTEKGTTPSEFSDIYKKHIDKLAKDDVKSEVVPSSTVVLDATVDVKPHAIIEEGTAPAEFSDTYRKHLSKLAKNSVCKAKSGISDSSKHTLTLNSSLNNGATLSRNIKSEFKLKSQNLGATKPALYKVTPNKAMKKKAHKFLDDLMVHYKSLKRHKRKQFLVQNNICYFHALHGSKSLKCSMDKCSFAQYLS